MRQSRLMSFIEAVANCGRRLWLGSADTGFLAFPLFGLTRTLANNLDIGVIFTLVSLARSYALRRLFEALRA
jgi:hypothetical protein